VEMDLAIYYFLIKRNVDQGDFGNQAPLTDYTGEQPMYRTIKTRQTGRMLLAQLSNPPHAFMNETMVLDLEALVDHADRDPGIGVVVLTGDQPDRFIAHFDVAEILQKAQSYRAITEGQAKLTLSLLRKLLLIPGMRRLLNKTPASGALFLLRFHEMLLKMGRSGTIFIAAINGETAGGGIELAMACDLRYMSSEGDLSQIEVLLGFPPGAGGTQRLTRLIGRANALEMMLTGRAISAEEAQRIGLVTQVFAHEHLLDKTLAIAEKLSHFLPDAISAIKRATLEGGSLPLTKGLQMEQACMLNTMGLEPSKRAMAKYVAHVDKDGVVPCYKADLREQMETGRFQEFNSR
jgi:enoyl-CoA hydratase/carnithine racemase